MNSADQSWMLLKKHPQDSGYFGAFHVESKVAIDPTTQIFRVSFRLTGPMSEITWPKDDGDTHDLQRDQTLWKHTCFEFFIGTAVSANYYEWNMAPAKKWGHFRFQSYRNPESSNMDEGGVKKIEFKREVNSGLLNAEIDLGVVPSLKHALENKIPLLLSTTVILENRKGEKSHWALTHQDAQPDFHRSSSFIAKTL